MEDLAAAGPDLGEVGVDGPYTGAVVDDNDAAVAAHGAGELDGSGGHGADGGPGGRADVHTAVDLEVEAAVVAESVGGGQDAIEGPAGEGASGQEEGSQEEDHSLHT